MSANDDGKPAGELQTTALEALLGFQLRRAQLKLFQHFAAAMAELALSPGQAGVLILIENNPGISQAALARALEIERATLGETIAGLQQRDWLERRRSANDARSLALYLSVNGHRRMKKVHLTIRQHEREISRGLTAQEGRELHRLIRKFNSA